MIIKYSTLHTVWRALHISKMLPILVFGGIMLSFASQAAMSYLDNGVVKVGIDTTKGGSITYLSVSGTTNNVINSSDLGREVQQSYYSGPNPYNPSNNINPSWNPWPWNPIQSGDSYGNASRVLTNSNNGQTIYVKCIPMQWALNKVPGECTFESWITLSGNAVIVSNRLLNARSDTNQYAGYGQELPAVYTVGTLYNLFTYSGNAPFTGDAVTNLLPLTGPPNPWNAWSATESWAAMLNATNWGLGIYNPGAVQFGGGFVGTPGSGGPSSGNAGYIAPVQTDNLDSNIVYTFNYHLILGTLTQIRNWVYAQPYRPGLNSVFQSDRQHWWYNNTTDTGWPLTNNRIRVNLAGFNPMIFSSVCAFFATNVPTIYIRAAYHIANPAGHTGANFYWLTNGSAPNAFTAGEGTSFPIIVDGQYHTYAVNLAAESNYTSVITQLRFDPTFNSAVGDYVDVAAISSSPIATQNLILNGNFTANAAAFTTYPGYALPSGTVAITNWVNALGGLVGLNGPATGAAVGNPFSPTNAGLRTFAFIQGGSTVLTQGLPATYTTNATYQFSFDVAARAGNTNVTFRVQIGDNSVVHVGTGNLIANPAGFTHYIYTFTSPATFNGAPSVQLWNLTAGDNTVDFANVSLVLLWIKSPATTTLMSSANPSTYGGAVTLTATVTTTNGVPTGTVTFQDGVTTLGMGTLGSGSSNTLTATLTLTNLSASSHSLTASYGGDTNFIGSTSSALAQVVNLKPLTVTGLTAGNKVYDGGTNAALTGAAALVGVVGGDTVTLAGTPAASFSDKNVGTAKTVSVSGYTLGGASATNYSLAQPALSANITARPVTLSGSRVYDSTTTAAASILTIGNNVDGANLTLSGSGTLAGANVGSQAISAGTLALGGSAAGNYTLVGMSSTVTITAASSATALAASLNPSLPGTNVVFTATVSAVPPGSGTPTNAVQFRTNGVAAALVNLNSSAQALYATSSLPHGSNVVTAEYLSDGNFLASTNNLVLVVNTPPVANALTLGAVSGLLATIQIIGGSNAPTDADGDPLTVTAVGVPAHGIASADGTNATYTATNNFVGSDSFNYTVSDNYGATATNAVTVNVIANNAGVNRMTAGLSGGNLVLAFLGIPWNNYALDQTFSLSPPVWLPVVTNLTPANGQLLFTNQPTGSNSFWRTRYVP